MHFRSSFSIEVVETPCQRYTGGPGRRNSSRITTFPVEYVLRDIYAVERRTEDREDAGKQRIPVFLADCPSHLGLARNAGARPLSARRTNPRGSAGRRIECLADSAAPGLGTPRPRGLSADPANPRICGAGFLYRRHL